jgi:Na+/H+-translocating membrane pyrophosphatase
MYGVALAAIGFLSNLATGLTIDVYGPVCDNAGGKSILLLLLLLCNFYYVIMKSDLTTILFF